MDNLTDPELLRQYAESGSEPAFRTLVERYINLVHSTALRILNGDSHLARDVAQTVFTDLARKAGSLSNLPQKRETLTGWLYTATRFAAMKVLRAEQTRRAHEEEAHKMNELAAETNPDWSELRPVLDDAMGQLGAADREAILLRIFEGKEFGLVGRQLGLSEEAARKRVVRALDKLRGILARRGVTASSAALSAVLAANVIEAAPAGLAASIASSSIVAATTTAAATGAGVLAFLKLMAFSKTKTAGLAIGLVLGLGTAFFFNTGGSKPMVVTKVVTRITWRTNSTAAPAAAPATLFGFHWSQLESADYRQYVANLKAIDCPRDTLKDIIIADLNTLYAPKLAKLRTSPAADQWWLTADQTRRVEWRQESDANRVENEKRDILRELLGIDAVEALDAVWGVDEQTKNDLACIPAEKRGQVAEINVLFSQREMEVRNRSMGMMDREVEAAIKRIRNERRAALEQLLSPSELFEFDLRFSEPSRRLRDFSPTFEYTETEFRAAFAAKEKFEGAFGDGGRSYDPNNAESREKRRVASEQMQAAVKQALGEQRYAEWRRSQDNDFQILYDFGQKHQVSDSSIVEVYNMKEQALATANQLRNDPNLSYEEARTMRREIRGMLERAILDAMGEEAGAQYLKQWGPSLNGIASKPQ
jgi:RNA polymerase sigma factor (sigma-70 family)